MPFVNVDAQSIFYTRHGGTELANAGPPLLLVHGAGGSHLHWPAHLRRLADRIVYALDLPGHGRSLGPGRTSIEAYASFLCAFVSALRIEKFVLAGHSMGGAIALAVAIQQVERLAGLILVGAGARLAVSPALLQALQDDFAGATATITRLAHSPETPASERRRFLDQLRKNDPVVLRDDFLACAQFDQRSSLDKVSIPTLLIYGRQDRMTPVANGEQLHAQLPRSELHVVEDAGHMAMLENAHAVIDLFQAFIEGVSTPQD
ncbi:MAG: alpha/beta fold hydrolase [Caldilineaceae bacterium]|nr:alpha/beta fold hydrolase [Caldilineaceae bacterium]